MAGNFEYVCSAGGLLALSLAILSVTFFHMFSVNYSVITVFDSISP